MSEIEEVQEQLKADMEAMKEQMAAMMEAMYIMKEIIESNAVVVATTSAAAEVDPTHPSGLNQVNPLVLDMVGQGREALGSTSGPHVVQSKISFLPYGLPPNYSPPNAVLVPNEDVNNSAPIPIKSQQPQSNHAHVSQPMRETYEAPRDHNLADVKPHLGYATEGQAVGCVPLPNTFEGPQFLPQPQPLHFCSGKSPAMVERGKLDHIKERLRANEGGGDYTFAGMEELFLVPNVVIPPKFKMSDFDKYKGTTCPKNHLKI